MTAHVQFNLLQFLIFIYIHLKNIVTSLSWYLFTLYYWINVDSNFFFKCVHVYIFWIVCCDLFYSTIEKKTQTSDLFSPASLFVHYCCGMKSEIY